MRVFAKLGVSSKKDLKDPRTCVLYGRHAANVSNALSMAEWYLSRENVGKLSKSEREHLSASLLTSGNSAIRMSSVLDPATEKKAVAYALSAKSIHKLVSSASKSDMAELQARVAKLRKKADELTSDVVSQCTEDLKPAQKPASSMSGQVAPLRTGMGARFLPPVFKNTLFKRRENRP